MPSISPYSPHIEAQFMNTYVPIPFQEMLAAGQMKQGRYDQAANAIDSGIAALDEIQAIPNSADELRAKEYSNKMRDIRDKYTGRDLSDPFVQRELSNEIHRSVDKEDIKHIQQSYQGYLGYNKALAQNEAQGKATPSWARQQFEGYDSKANGVFTGNPEIQLDMYDDTSRFFKGMGMTRKGNVNVAPGVGAIRYAKDEKDIINHAERNIEAFMDLPSVRQYIRGMKAQGAVNGRKDEELALDYIRSNWRQWAEEKLDPFSIPAWAGNQSSNPTTPKTPPEVIMPAGVKDAVKLKKKDSREGLDQLETLAAAGDINSENQLNSIKAKTEIANQSYNAQIEEKRIAADIAFRNAINALKKTNMSSDEAYEYLQANSQTNKQGTPISIEAGIGRNKNTDENIVNALASPAQVTSSLFSNKFIKNIKKDPEKEQILVNYLDSVKEIESSIEELEGLKEDEFLEAYNESLGHQDTYTVLDQMYDFEGGKVKGTFVDKNGTEKVTPSIIAAHINNLPYNLQDYQYEVINNRGKTLGKDDEESKKILQSADGFKVLSLDNKTGDNGEIIIELQATKKDDTGKSKLTGNKFRIWVPMRNPEERNYFVNELLSNDQQRTAFNFVNYDTIEQAVSEKNIYSGDNVISLKELGDSEATDEDRIELKIRGGGIIPILYYKGTTNYITQDMEGNPAPVSYNNLANYITSFLQRYSSQVQ